MLKLINRVSKKTGLPPGSLVFVGEKKEEEVKKEKEKMESLKQEALNAISKMPDSSDIDEIMYRLYVIDKVRKGKEAVERGETVSIEELKKEIESW